MNKSSIQAIKLTALAATMLSLGTPITPVFASRCAAFDGETDGICSTGGSRNVHSGARDSTANQAGMLSEEILQAFGGESVYSRTPHIDLRNAHGTYPQQPQPAWHEQGPVPASRAPDGWHSGKAPGHDVWQYGNDHHSHNGSGWMNNRDPGPCGTWGNTGAGACGRDGGLHSEPDGWFQHGYPSDGKFPGHCTRGDGVPPPSTVPVPAAVWLFGSGLIGLFGVARRWNA